MCDQSYASHGRDFLLGATILNSSEKPFPFISSLKLGDIACLIDAGLRTPHRTPHSARTRHLSLNGGVSSDAPQTPSHANNQNESPNERGGLLSLGGCQIAVFFRVKSPPHGSNCQSTPRDVRGEQSASNCQIAY